MSIPPRPQILPFSEKSLRVIFIETKHGLKVSLIPRLLPRVLIMDSQTFDDVNTWLDYKSRLSIFCPKFFGALASKHPSLTADETKLCALILMDCGTKMEAMLLGKSVRAVLALRKQLHFKLDLAQDDNIHAYLMSFC
jgi:AraC family chitin signaling transcriptional activator